MVHRNEGTAFMFDTPLPQMQRTRGAAGATVKARDGRTVLEGLRQQGSAKAFLPRVDSPDPEIVFLNTAGGLTGGDKLSYSVSVGARGRATAATQTAERAYRAAQDVAQVEVRLRVGAGAELHWLPQETILFDGAALDRRTEVDLAPDARFLMVETVVLGRAAMGEAVAVLDFTDRRIIRRDGVPVMVEPLRFDTDALRRTGPAALADARAEAQAIITQTKAEIKAELEAATKKADAEISARTADSEAKIAELREGALESIKAVSKDTAKELVGAMGVKAEARAVTAAVNARLKG